MTAYFPSSIGQTRVTGFGWPIGFLRGPPVKPKQHD